MYNIKKNRLIFVEISEATEEGHGKSCASVRIQLITSVLFQHIIFLSLILIFFGFLFSSAAAVCAKKKCFRFRRIWTPLNNLWKFSPATLFHYKQSLPKERAGNKNINILPILSATYFGLTTFFLCVREVEKTQPRL